jgi:endonuclease YncB( thermonuclease family)
LFVCGAHTATADSCRPAQFDEQVSVRYVYDGDTVILRDGRKLRLIGINTPERARDERPAEPYADAAREQLQLLAEGPWSLVYDRDRRDRYGRLLAHIFDSRGRNLTRRLLENGAGQWLVFPPNLKFADCYRHAQQSARADRRGLWALPAYRVREADELMAHDVRHYGLVRGRLTRVGESRSSLWLNLGPEFALRIARQDLAHFDRAQIDGWRQQTLTAQGWFYYRNNQWRLRLRHPLSVLDVTP